MPVDAPLPPLYLLAGNGGAADWWTDALPHFTRHRPLPIELPGFGDNVSAPLDSLESYARALIGMTQPGQTVFAVGVNALVVLHALRLAPGHFRRSVLLAPVGAFLWQRRLPALMAPMPMRRIVHWVLSNRPQWLHRNFTRQAWPATQYQRIAAGYRRCRAFLPYWDMVQPHSALELLEWVDAPVDLVWGGHDGVLGSSQAAAWSAILARTDLSVTLQPEWGHYPWIDAPHEFARWLESGQRGFIAHGKAGRLTLATLAGLPVPAATTVSPGAFAWLSRWLGSQPGQAWAVRSSSRSEDQADSANAGLSQTFLRVATAEVPDRVDQLLGSGVEEVVVQRFIEARVSGIAFVRRIAAEVEWVKGHLEALADGSVVPHRTVLSPLGAAWRQGSFSEIGGLTERALWEFLQRVLRTFHYVHGDVEWAWDGERLWLLQYRPVTTYGWRRHITAANISEILPAQPSRLVEHAQRRAAGSTPAVMARWDSRVLEDNEPFTVSFEDASYINNDLFLARLADWGVSAQRYADEVGSTTPALPWRPLRLLRALPVFWRMQRESRSALKPLAQRLRSFDDELRRLQASSASGSELAAWFVRFHLQCVQGNLFIGVAVASAGGAWLGSPGTTYRELAVAAVHRLPWETDPATPRAQAEPLLLRAFPGWPWPIACAHVLGLPGMRGHYLQVREWYRDNLMRIFFRLHHAMPLADRAEWFAPHPYPRTRAGGFWQDGSADGEVARGFLIYPGDVQGVLGEDILFEESLDPGRHAAYRQAKAVVSRIGGRLSHGATLLRELRRPSAVLPSVDPSWRGRKVRFADGALSLLED